MKGMGGFFFKESLTPKGTEIMLSKCMEKNQLSSKERLRLVVASALDLLAC